MSKTEEFAEKDFSVVYEYLRIASEGLAGGAGKGEK